MNKEVVNPFFLVIVILTFLLAPTASTASEENTNDAHEIINSIEVRGNHHIESLAILANIKSQVGQPLSRREIAHDIQRLYQSGYLSDIKVHREASEKQGVKLLFSVVENPLILEMKIEGNDAIPDKDLKPKMKLKAGFIFSNAGLTADKLMIRRAYLKKGFYQVAIHEQRQEGKEGRISLTLQVDEGDVTRIRSIRFIGNLAFSDSELKDEIASRESNFSSWFSDRDLFERDRLGSDRGLLEQKYFNQGYLDARVESTLISLSTDKQWFYLTFNIHEGEQFHIGKIEFQGDIVPDEEKLREALQIETGALYSITGLRNTIEKLTHRVGDEGYAFANVTPLFHRKISERVVDIVFDIEKGREVYIERIEISGNHKTEDQVIRREFRQAEAERFASSKMERSKTRVKRLNLFEDIRVSMPKGSTSDKVKIHLEVDEKRTGTFSAGAGYSQLEKLFFTAKVEENNLFGKGFGGSFSGDFGNSTQNFTGSVSDPYLFGEDISGSINGFKTQTTLQEVVQYKRDDFGGGMGIGIPINEYFRYSVSYRYSNTNLTDIPDDASLIIQSQGGKQTTSEVIQSISWDTRDRRVGAASGHIESLSLGVAGLGGSNHYAEVQASTKSYFSLIDDFIFSPSLTARYIRGYDGNDIPIYKRYSLGGFSTLRGFDYYGVSIRDDATNDVIGGNKVVNASLNVFFPLPYLHTAGFRGVLFVDAGIVADDEHDLEWSELRASVGVGLEWMSPIGPIGMVWAVPIQEKEGDILRTFEFAIGATF
ncbi:MAG: outer membrane protein assembly factor BamA [Mariprofundaceae bacterium]